MKNRVATLTAQMVGRTPWSARDALVPLPSQRYQHHAERQQADGGVGRGPGVRLTRLRGCGFSTLLGWAFRPRNFMKNRCLRWGTLQLASRPEAGRAGGFSPLSSTRPTGADAVRPPLFLWTATRSRRNPTFR